jgi:hypothetical protein
MGLELERNLKLFFKKSEANYQSSISYVFYVARLFLIFKEPIGLQFDTNIIQLG